METFRTRRRVEFQHCDPAGIVFYPRYFEMVNSVVEEWFGAELGLSFARMHAGGDRVGVPTVRIEAEFPAPSRLGDELGMELQVEALGRASATLSVEGRAGGELRLAARPVLVFISGAEMRPTPWPAAQRAQMSRFLMVENEAAG